MNLVLAVAGDRHYNDYEMFRKILKDELERFPAAELVTGDCTGVDEMVLTYSVLQNMPITIYCADRRSYLRLSREGFRCVLAADWGAQGKIAGPIRNHAMLRHPAQRLLVLDGGGPGSRSVRKIANREGIPVEVWNITNSLASIDEVTLMCDTATG